MGFQVTLTHLAEGDLEAIVRYISRDKPSAAIRVGQQLIEKLRNLENFPLIGRVVPEFADENLREIVHSPYRIIYLIQSSSKRIEVIRIWHGARGEPEV